MRSRAGQDTTDYDPAKFPRYEVLEEDGLVFDTKFKRNLVAQCRRGNPPHYRLVDTTDRPHYILASQLFSEEVTDDLIDITSDFEPEDFIDRYDFNLEEGKVVKKTSGKEPKIQTSDGWNRYLLTRNDGKRVSVTPAEIKNLLDREEWAVTPPSDCRCFPQFPHVAFSPDGRVLRIVSNTPMFEPKPVLPERTAEGTLIYTLTSKEGKSHRITDSSIRKVFDK